MRNPTITLPEPYPRDLAVLEDVNAHPVHLADATRGAKVELIVRRNPGKRTDGPSPAEPADWAPPPPTGAPLLIVDPIWRILPPANVLKLFYPDRAYRSGISGDAAATCSIGPAGDLVGCWLASENPANEEFGIALLVVTTFLQIDPAAKSGLPSPGRTIKVGMHFTVSRGGAFAAQLVVLTAQTSVTWITSYGGHWPEPPASRRSQRLRGDWGTAVLSPPGLNRGNGNALDGPSKEKDDGRQDDQLPLVRPWRGA